MACIKIVLGRKWTLINQDLPLGSLFPNSCNSHLVCPNISVISFVAETSPDVHTCRPESDCTV